MDKCPVCGGNLRLRTAKRGRNAGGQFYGCANWKPGGKGCSYTASVEEVEGAPAPESSAPVVAEATIDAPPDRSEIRIPRPFTARPKFRSHECVFHQTAAIDRNSVVELQGVDQRVRRNVECAAVWRMDIPKQPRTMPDGKHRFLLELAMKVVTRGRITAVSPSLEAALGEIGRQANSPQSPGPLEKPNDTGAGASPTPMWFDGESGSEERFYYVVAPKLLGNDWSRLVVPQVPLSSLVHRPDLDAAILSQRVDFLITAGDFKAVVEIDGAEHQDHMEQDLQRDQILTQDGFSVFRIKNEEVETEVGPNIHKLFDAFEAFRTGLSDLSAWLQRIDPFIRIAHQLQVAVLDLLMQGVVDSRSAVGINSASLSVDAGALSRLCDATMADLSELISHLASLYGIDYSLQEFSIDCVDTLTETPHALLTFDDELSAAVPTVCVQDLLLDHTIAASYCPAADITPVNVQREDVQFFLHYLLGHEELREGQFEAIERALTGKDAIVLLPTGHGKSAAFQIASMMLPGVTVVVDPIISLIDDQLDNLRRYGIDRAIGISSQIESVEARSDAIAAFGQGQYIFCYVAPERFQTEQFRDSLRALTVSTQVSLIAIDEAHCVSEWGHDFRTAYLNIGRTTREYCKSPGGRVPPVLALTGTASHAVLRDIQRELEIADFEAIITPTSFDRSELNFAIFRSKSAEKTQILKGLVGRWMPEHLGANAGSFFEPAGASTMSGLVFCPHVNGQFGVAEISRELSSQTAHPVGMYSGAPPKHIDAKTNWNVQKQETARAFKNDQFALMAATKSFGMGIDKPNIRYTIHYGIPPSIEAFYQEAGRAGRDRQKAQCCIIFSNDNASRTETLLSPQASVREVVETMTTDRTWETDDDITRVMYFHTNAFRGIDAESDDIDRLVSELGDLESERSDRVVAWDGDRKRFEKAVHRLVTLGVLSDYTINYSSNEFRLRFAGATQDLIADKYAAYVQAYNRGRVATEIGKVRSIAAADFPSFVQSAARVLLEFVYDTIERGRRRALREMLSLCEDAVGNDANTTVREKILRYLESTYSEELEDIVQEVPGFEMLRKLVDGTIETSSGEQLGGIRSPRDAMGLRGQVARYLESYPDHPGLLFLRAVAEAHCPEHDANAITDNLLAGVKFATERYEVDASTTSDMLAWSLSKIGERLPEEYEATAVAVVYGTERDDVTRNLLRSQYLPPDGVLEPATFLLGRLCDQLQAAR